MSREGGKNTDRPELPEPFQDLTPFAHWALQPERARTELRLASSKEEIQAFHDTMMLRIDEILDYLDEYFDEDMPDPVQHLFLMSLALVEVVTVLEVYGQREAVDSCDPLRFIPQYSTNCQEQGASVEDEDM